MSARNLQVHWSRVYASNKSIAAICAAPLVLANLGLLDGKTATCYPNVLNPNDWPNITLKDAPVVIDNNILTSKGPGTALDFALVIIEFLTDKNVRDSVEKDLVRPQIEN